MDQKMDFESFKAGYKGLSVDVQWTFMMYVFFYLEGIDRTDIMVKAFKSLDRS